MPDLLREQQPHFKPLVEAFGYRNFSVPKREADDVIGTLSRIADEAGIQTTIVSTDRDAFQLVSDRVSLMMTPRGVADVHVYTPERVETRLGMPRELVPDLIGLKGDPGDNIQGVPGIGDKTAADLLREFGSLEGVYENLDRGLRRQAQGDAGGQPRRGDQGQGARHDRPRPGGARRPRPAARSSTSRPTARSWPTCSARWSSATCCAASTSSATARRCRGRSAAPRRRCASCSCRSSPSGPAVPRRRGWRPPTGTWRSRSPTRCWWWRRMPPPWRGALDGPGLVAHDFKSLPHALLAAGLAPAFDSFLAAYLIDPGRPTYALDDLLAEAGIGIEIDGPEQLADVGRAALAPVRLRERMRGAPRGAPPDAPAWPTSSSRWCGVLAAMEDVGVRVDPDVLDGIRVRVEAEVEELEDIALHERPAASSRSARRSSSARCCSRSWACPPTARARRATRPTSACWPRSATCTRSSPVVERWRELTKLHSTYLVRAAAGHRRATGASTPPSGRRRRAPAGSPARTPTCRTSPCARSSGKRDPRAPSSRPTACGCCRRTTRRSSCASSPTCPASPCWPRRSGAGRTCTARPPRRCWAGRPRS